MESANKVALVTGGSRGIGRAVALRLAKDGATVVVNYVSNEGAARDVVEQILGAGGAGAVARGDVSVVAEAGAMVEKVLADFGRIDILVNNAGITRDALLLRMGEE